VLRAVISGESMRNRIPVSQLIAAKLPVTVELAVCSMVIALLIGIPAGVIAAVHQGRPVAVAANVLASPVSPVPHFWLGIMLIRCSRSISAGCRRRVYRAVGRFCGEISRRSPCPRLRARHRRGGVMMRHTRGAMVETLGADYVQTARAKSVTERMVVLKHALRNALIPVVTLGAIEFGRLLSGAVLTEQIFAIPGFGKMLVDGVFNRDYAVVQGVVLVSATLYVLLNLAGDVLAFLVNPRLRGPA
jgi:peptide/nickel transport system permease protein